MRKGRQSKAAKRNIRAASESVAARLGNTATICRKCCIHPEVFDAYLSDALTLEVCDRVEEELRDNLANVRHEEALVLAFLQEGLSRKARYAAAVRSEG